MKARWGRAFRLGPSPWCCFFLSLLSGHRYGLGGSQLHCLAGKPWVEAVQLGHRGEQRGLYYGPREPGTGQLRAFVAVLEMVGEHPREVLPEAGTWR